MSDGRNDPQRQIDTRALEVASEAKGAVGELSSRMEVQRREHVEADEHLRVEIRSGFDKLGLSIKDLHGRLDADREKRFNTFIRFTGSSAMVALALIGFLAGKLLGWL